MRFRNSRVRTKVTALLVSLAALWAFSAWVTLREGLNLVWVKVYDGGIAQPSEPLLIELQKERRLLAVRQGNPRAVPRQALVAQRARTDAAAAEFRRLARGSDVELAADALIKSRIDESITQLNGLGRDRQAIDSGRADHSQAIGLYTGVIDSIYRTYDSLATLDDKGAAKDTRTLIELSRARELLAREDALLAGVLAAGRYGQTDHAAFAQIVGARRYVTARALVELPATDRAVLEQLEKGPAFTRLQGLEDTVLESGTRGVVPTVTSDQWNAATGPVLAELQKAIVDGGDRLVERATPIAVGVVVRLVLAGVLGLFAVIASIVLSITTARALVNQLEKLRTAALELANERLPSVVARLAHGEKVDVAAEAPRLEFGGDVIGQVGQAFNAVQETAIRTAVEEAQLRQSIRDILLSLARRTQSLVHRQLTLLDVMERRETDEAELKDLFRVDHLATRMRRNAENLIVLSGASPARAWRRSVPMVDVVRGALAEVEDYTRVTVLPMGQVELTGRAVGDVIHLLAELIENALVYSPPDQDVEIQARGNPTQYQIAIVDQGVGMPPGELETANARLRGERSFLVAPARYLGHYVVGRLARRLGIKVWLHDSPLAGITARVVLPAELMVGGRPQAREPEPAMAAVTGPLTALPTSVTGPLPALPTAAGPTLSKAVGPTLPTVGGPAPGAAASLPASARTHATTPLSAPLMSPPEATWPPTAPAGSTTPNGLVRRVPRARRPEAPARYGQADPQPRGEQSRERSAEQVRSMLNDFRSGAHRSTHARDNQEN